MTDRWLLNQHLRRALSRTVLLEMIDNQVEEIAELEHELTEARARIDALERIEISAGADPLGPNHDRPAPADQEPTDG